MHFVLAIRARGDIGGAVQGPRRRVRQDPRLHGHEEGVRRARAERDAGRHGRWRVARGHPAEVARGDHGKLSQWENQVAPRDGRGCTRAGCAECGPGCNDTPTPRSRHVCSSIGTYRQSRPHWDVRHILFSQRRVHLEIAPAQKEDPDQATRAAATQRNRRTGSTGRNPPHGLHPSGERRGVHKGRRGLDRRARLCCVLARCLSGGDDRLHRKDQVPVAPDVV
mmetsp:Transcript_123974/g.355877  ORF Transcript_123974/g.355877 Transcript_123974/m.355877 type:complete len:223 (+) Transcript_123974:604-1272(+)